MWLLWYFGVSFSAYFALLNVSSAWIFIVLLTEKLNIDTRDSLPSDLQIYWASCSQGSVQDWRSRRRKWATTFIHFRKCGLKSQCPGIFLSNVHTLNQQNHPSSQKSQAYWPQWLQNCCLNIYTKEIVSVPHPGILLKSHRQTTQLHAICPERCL